MKLKTFVVATLLCYGLQSQAQLGDLVKNKLAKKKEKQKNQTIQTKPNRTPNLKKQKSFNGSSSRSFREF